MNQTDPIIGHRRFDDGSSRPVYLGPDSRQYVLDDDGTKVIGPWLKPSDVEPDKPVIVEPRT